MSKIGIAVGEDFPASEAASPDPGREEARCPDSEEWHRRHEEWHARAKGFREDVRHAAHRHFGEFTGHNAFVMRALLGVALIALAFAILPHMLLLALFLLGVIFFLTHRGDFHHHHSDAPRDGN